MPDQTTTTIKHALILVRQTGDGFYLTPDGQRALFLMWVTMFVLLFGIFLAVVLRRTA